LIPTSAPARKESLLQLSQLNKSSLAGEVKIKQPTWVDHGAQQKSDEDYKNRNQCFLQKQKMLQELLVRGIKQIL